jgi:SOS-response transcriptional repressor LexA
LDVIFPARHYPDMESVLQKRLRERMEEKGVKAAPLALQAGLGASFVRDIIRGKTRSPSHANLTKLAKALDTTPEYLTGVVDGERLQGLIEGPPLSFAGIVQAGMFRPVDEYFLQDDVEVPDFVTAHPGYRRARQYTWRVVGSSMDAANIRDGMWVVGVDYGDYIDRYGDVESGEFLVVQRSRHGDSERELTVKEVKFYRDRMELLPRSTDPTFQPIIVPHNTRADGDTEIVTILAVVVGAYLDLQRK